MLRGIIICPDEGLATDLERALQESGSVEAVRSSRYPTPQDLDRWLREHQPQVVFVSLDSLDQALDLKVAMDRKASGVAVVAVHHSSDPELLVRMMRAGVREFLAPPFEQGTLREALVRISSLVERPADLPNRVYAFLPSKPGVGTSTLALNTSLALARAADGRVLLMDFDLNNGMIGFLLRLNSQYSVVDAVEHAHEMDRELWGRLVTSVDKLDVLPAGRLNPGQRIDANYLAPLLNFARRNHEVVCVDLSGMMEKYSVALLRESARVFLVCTPEVPALHLGAQKLRYLHSQDMGHRVQVLMNRTEKNTVLSGPEMEKLLAAPIHMVFPNDYARVHKALMAGRGVEESSKLGRMFGDLARTLLGGAADSGAKKRRFVDYFSVASEQQPAGARR